MTAPLDYLRLKIACNGLAVKSRICGFVEPLWFNSEVLVRQ